MQKNLEKGGQKVAKDWFERKWSWFTAFSYVSQRLDVHDESGTSLTEVQIDKCLIPVAALQTTLDPKRFFFLFFLNYFIIIL